ncbi:MAG: hypothetical protein ACTSV2_04865 [Candidatus Thorarchaeota archaeon]
MDPWWIVLQDSKHKARMLVGCFSNKSLDKDGFNWAENNIDALTQYSIDEILGFRKVLMLCRTTEQGLETWSLGPDGESEYAGILEVKTRAYSSIGQLMALKQTHSDPSLSEPFQEVRPTEAFYQHAASSLRRYIDSITSPTPVTVHIEMIKGNCRVIFTDGEDTVVQEVEVEYVAELLSLLRWPMSRGQPMFTDIGVYVTWSVFDDIDYGELDFIRPYVTYKAARSVPEELPLRICQFFEDAISLPVSIEHVKSVCPVVLDEEMDHGVCWRIILPPKCPRTVRKQLEGPMTGEGVNGLLAPGRLYAGRLYTFELSLPEVSEKDESVVFHEDKYIRIFLRDKGLSLKSLESGTYLNVKEQTWSVELSEPDAENIRWSARSTVSDLHFKGKHHLIKLVYAHGAKEECERILSIITSDIPEEKIVKYSFLRKQIMSYLKSLGYSSKSPSFEIRIDAMSETSCRYGVFPVRQTTRTPLFEQTINITGGERLDDIISGIEMSLSDGELSAFTILRKEIFLRKLTTWVKQAIAHVGDDFDDDYMNEPMSWSVELTIHGKAIYWIATQVNGSGQRSGFLYDDPKNLFDGNATVAKREVKESLKDIVVPELKNIDNLDELLNDQVSEIVKDLRQIQEEIDG